MPRRARRIVGGEVYHVLNRAAGRMTLFDEPADYDAFERIIDQARQRIALRLVGWCLMPNHWHLVVWPTARQGPAVSEFLRWLTVTHATRWRMHRHTVGEGPVYQGRFKAFPVQDDAHYLTLLRYVEGNAWRAQLVRRAEQWPWSSLWRLQSNDAAVRRSVDGGPLPRPHPLDRWLRRIHTPINRRELAALQRSLRHDHPFGHDPWITHTAATLDICHPPRPRGRPKKHLKK